MIYLAILSPFSNHYFSSSRLRAALFKKPLCLSIVPRLSQVKFFMYTCYLSLVYRDFLQLSNATQKWTVLHPLYSDTLLSTRAPSSPKSNLLAKKWHNHFLDGGLKVLHSPKIGISTVPPIGRPILRHL